MLLFICFLATIFGRDPDVTIGKTNLFILHPSIFRVAITPNTGSLVDQISLVVDLDDFPKVPFKNSTQGNMLTVQTSSLKIQIDTKTEKISFQDLNGQVILAEPDNVCFWQRICPENVSVQTHSSEKFFLF